jgi:hypothetical protein
MRAAYGSAKLSARFQKLNSAAAAAHCPVAPAAADMPATLTVHILEAKGLPVMDTGSNSTDAYVEVRLSKKYFKKSATAMRSLNPVWDEVRAATASIAKKGV